MKLGPSKRAVQHWDDRGLYIDDDGTYWRQRQSDGAWRQMKGGLRGEGHLMMTVKGTQRIAHREVYRAHVGPLIDGMVVVHLNGDRADNRASNLRQQAKQTEGDRSRIGKHGKQPKGEAHYGAKITAETARGIKELINDPQYRNAARTGRKKGTLQKAAAQFGVPYSTVINIAYYGAWKNV